MASSHPINSTVRDWCSTNPRIHLVSIKWTISNYRELATKPGDFIRSSIFPEAAVDQQYKWRLRAYPNGTRGAGEGYLSVGLWLANEHIGVPVEASFSVSIINSANKEKNTLFSEKHEFKFIGDTKTINCFIINNKLLKPESKLLLARKLLKSRAKLSFGGKVLEPESKLLPGGKLTLLCRVKVYSGTTSISGQSNLGPIDTGRLPDELEGILDSKLFSDIDIKVGDRIFKAHKAILAARSPLLRAKFTESSVSSRLTVNDIRPEVFEQALGYIYTGQLKSFMEEEEEAASNESIKCRSAIELLHIATKFQLDELKLICQHQLYEQLSVETMGAILKAADLCEAQWLRRRVMKFATCQAAELTEKGIWKELAGHSPEMLAEMLARQWPAAHAGGWGWGWGWGE